jgi:5-methylcytosine-specific restriction endonuclease McrA
MVAGGTVTPDDIAAVLKAHTSTKTGQLICAFCGKPIKGKYHIDHWIPLKHGGRHEAGNLRVMHPRCNLHKNATHPYKLGMLI